VQIIFTSTKTLSGKLIRWGTERSWLKTSTVNHVALRYGRKESKWMVESNRHGFVPNWWPVYMKDKHRKHCYKFEIQGIDEELLEEIVDGCIDELIHKPYDFLGIIGFGIIIGWYQLTGKKIKNPFGSNRSYICTESMYYILKKIEKATGEKMVRDFDRETIFPESMKMDLKVRSERYKISENCFS